MSQNFGSPLLSKNLSISFMQRYRVGTIRSLPRYNGTTNCRPDRCYNWCSNRLLRGPEAFCTVSLNVLLDNQKEAVLTMKWTATTVIHSPCTQIYIASPNNPGFTKFGSNFGSVHDCFIPKTSSHYSYSTSPSLPLFMSTPFNSKSRQRFWRK